MSVNMNNGKEVIDLLLSKLGDDGSTTALYLARCVDTYLDEIGEQCWDEGYACGKKTGRLDGMQEIRDAINKRLGV